jgi:hypothetical protein
MRHARVHDVPRHERARSPETSHSDPDYTLNCDEPDTDTRAYVERRRAEGHTTKEIRRCLKRYLARQIYRYLNDAHAQATAT